MSRLSKADCSGPGIKRLRRGKGFSYQYPNGQRVSQEDKDRIEKLVIPPAWEDVWICIKANGHLQATGIDEAGRKQYIYHSLWMEKQSIEKFDHMLDFASRLPAIREQVNKDLQGDEFSKRQIVALSVRLLDRGFFRIGSERYHTSYGLATLRKDHLHLQTPDTLQFNYPAKHQQPWNQVIYDPLLYPLLEKLKQRRVTDNAPELLAYKRGRKWQDLKSQDINDYLAELTQGELPFPVTAKIFRTWHGTLIAAMYLGIMHLQSPQPDKFERRQHIQRAVKETATYLSNTPAVSKSSYIDPRIWDRYDSGITIASAIERVWQLDDFLNPEVQLAIEAATINLLKGYTPAQITRGATRILEDIKS